MPGDDVVPWPLPGAVPLCATAAVMKKANAKQIDRDKFFIANLLLLDLNDRPFPGFKIRKTLAI